MNALPQLDFKQRVPRLRFENSTPAVLRFHDGQRMSGEIQVVSLTGGLLSLPTPLTQGSRVKVMFVTDAGSVLGGAEMLSPVSGTQQPFRFVSLAVQDRRRLESIIPVSVYQDITEPDWMKKLRAVSEDRYAPPPPSRVKMAVLAVSLMALGLAGATFFLHVPLLKWIGK
jgi:hypothetical protein